MFLVRILLPYTNVLPQMALVRLQRIIRLFMAYNVFPQNMLFEIGLNETFAMWLKLINVLFNLQARPENFHYLTRIHYADTGNGIWGEHEIDYILFLHKDVDLKPNPNEVSELRFVSRKQLER